MASRGGMPPCGTAASLHDGMDHALRMGVPYRVPYR